MSPGLYALEVSLGGTAIANVDIATTRSPEIMIPGITSLLMHMLILSLHFQEAG